MSAKWRAMQHRHKWTYGVVNFPSRILEILRDSEFSDSAFFQRLREFASLNSTYLQVNAAKDVASAFLELVSGGGNNPAGLVDLSIRLYLEILFLENSLPVHRALISVLAKNRSLSSHRPAIGRCFKLLCGEYGVAGRRFSIARASLSLISYPGVGFLAETVGNCCGEVASDICNGLKSVFQEIRDGSRPSPVVMEQCQDAMSCLYYVLQRFPSQFASLEGAEESSGVFDVVVDAVFNVLKSSEFSRDCLVGAGVSLCAALQACMSHWELAICISSAVFRRPGYSFNAVSKQETLENNHSDSAKLVGYGRKMKERLTSDIQSLSVLSRMCLLRGILTTVPRPVLNMQFNLSADGYGSNDAVVWTILFDGVLSELCEYCENPSDSHFNFHALTVTQIALQQVKTSFISGLLNTSSDYVPFSDSLANRMMRIIWNNLEDPLNQTVKQVHLIFDLFLDIQSVVFSRLKLDIKSFYSKIAGDLLNLSGRCKGRYVPLASVTKRLGAKALLNMSPKELLSETIQAYIDDDVCCAATSFLKCFLELLRDECWQSDGIEGGYMSFRRFSLPPILRGLVSGLRKLRSNLNTYALPLILDVDVDSIFPMLDFVCDGRSTQEHGIVTHGELLAELPSHLNEDQRVTSLVSLLKVARSLALIEGDINWWCNSLSNGTEEENEHEFAVIHIKDLEIKVLVKWLESALSHVDDILRIDAAESLFLNPKTSSLPSPLELSLMRKTIPLNMRCSSTAFQMKWTSLFRKFFSRVKTALERQVKIGCWKPLLQLKVKSDTLESESAIVCHINGSTEMVEQKAYDLFCFMKWLSRFLFFSCYPSAPYERKMMAMDLLIIMMNVWPITPSVNSLNDPSSTCTNSLYPYSGELVWSDSTLSLVGSIVDSWDRLRESSFHILLNFPTPLPGISNEDKVKEVIVWAKRLVCSPRVRESDAGALTLRLIFQKYVLDLGWVVKVSDNVVVSQNHFADGFTKACIPDRPVHWSHTCKSKSPLSEYVLSLVEWLQIGVEAGEKDLSEACQSSFVHGILLSLRYTFEELDWNSEMVTGINSDMKVALEKLLKLVTRITSLSLWVVSSDAWYMADDLDDQVEDGSLLLDLTGKVGSGESLSVMQNEELKHVDDSGPAEHIVMVGCWLAMKEVSLLLGTITRKIPLPSCVSCFSDASDRTDKFSVAVEMKEASFDGILDANQLESIGMNFLQVLLKMKHNGAIDKTRAGFTALCNRLLCSNNPRLCKMTECWMEQLMQRTISKGQTVDDLLRRSAGIPAAFIALFLAEPEGTPKKLLPRALRWLTDVANTSLAAVGEDSHLNGNPRNVSCMVDQVSSSSEECGRVSKIRDEGVIPTVHAFNVLRAAFNDTNLATDTSGFCAAALIASICAFSSPYWEIRNSACLAYTALVRRMIGFLNMHKRESARRALTGLEFFHRYPILHSFIFDKLKAATDWIGDVNQQRPGHNLAALVHPSLCPILILLSRLKPSVIGSDSSSSLDPFVFMPFVRQCATQNNQRIRVLASKALSGLVSNERLPAVLLYIASGLPCGKSVTSVSGCTCIGPVSFGMNKLIEVGKPHVASANAIHGILLQLCSLINVNFKNLTDDKKKDQLLGELFAVLVNCAWIGSVKSCLCPTLTAAYLELLAHMLDIARNCQTSNHLFSIQRLLTELTSQCLGAWAQCQADSTFFDPTLAELHRKATGFYFDCVLGSCPGASDDGLSLKLNGDALNSLSSPGILEREMSDIFCVRFEFCISNASHEVRLAALKGLLRFLKSIASKVIHIHHGDHIDNIVNWFNINLHPTLMRLLDVEDHPKCVCYILRIIFCWSCLQFLKSNEFYYQQITGIDNMNLGSLSQLWDKLISIKETAKHIKTQEILICCMGVCVKKWTMLFRNLMQFNGAELIDSSIADKDEACTIIFNGIHYFVMQVKQCSSSSKPVNMRKAAADALVASGLLEEAVWVSSVISNNQMVTKVYERAACDDRTLMVQSNALNLYAVDILDSWFTCVALLEDEDVGLRQTLAMAVQKCVQPRGTVESDQTEAVPIQVEKVIELSFHFLSSIFGHWLPYIDCLSKWALVDPGSYPLGCGNLVRRVFDKEIDNHHEEKLLVCQICFFHLERLLGHKSFLKADEGIEESCMHADSCTAILSFLCKRRMEILDQTLSLINDLIKTETGANWIGGIGNHKDVFIPLYSSLLGLYALSHVKGKGQGQLDVETDRQSPLMAGIIALNEIISPLLRNPLIANMYLLVHQSYEKLLGIALDTSEYKKEVGHLAWEGFDPYFLLR
ncbi:Thyroid adenoma-associated protein-like protein [Nymphaea thermarum]|nr:Thyroid adenoma-associated protein-like protein [Nymphaea thermarum]